MGPRAERDILLFDAIARRREHSTVVKVIINENSEVHPLVTVSVSLVRCINSSGFERGRLGTESSWNLEPTLLLYEPIQAIAVQVF